MPFRSATSTAQTVAQLSVTVSKPAGLADGDVLVLAININGGNAVGFTGLTLPSGFTLQDSTPSSNGHRVVVATKAVSSASSEPSTYTTSWSGITANTSGAILAAYSGIDTTTPADVAASTTSNASSASPTTPTVTTASDNAIVLSILAADSGAVTTSSGSPAVTVRADVGGRQISLSDRVLATAGATGVTTLGYNSAKTHTGTTLALRPTGGGGGGSPPAGIDWFVSPTGSASGDGSIGNPWDKATAFARPGAANETYWFRAGIYVFSDIDATTHTYAVDATISSPTYGQPVTFRNYNNEHVVFEYTGGSSGSSDMLLFEAANVRLWGIELYNSKSTNFGDANYKRARGLKPNGVNFELVNCVLHDFGIAFSFFTANATNIKSVAHGNMLFNNGRTTTEHNIYAHNLTGIKEISNNIVWSAGGYNLHGWVDNDTYKVLGFRVLNNTSFDAGACGSSGQWRGNLFFALNHGGTTPTNVPASYGGDLLWDHNCTYYSTTNARSTGSNFDRIGTVTGSGNGEWTDYTLTNNYFARGSTAFTEQGTILGPRTVAGNTVYGAATDASGTSFATVFPGNGNSYNSQPTTSTPGHIDAIPNDYEPGRYHITVYNWALANTVNVPASQLTELPVGTSYRIVSPFTYRGGDTGTNLATGTYDGNGLTLDMTNLPAPPAPIASSNGLAMPDPGKEFAVFILLPIDTGVPPMAASIKVYISTAGTETWGASAETGIKFNRDATVAGTTAPVPIPTSAPGTNYSWHKNLALYCDSATGAGTSISNRKIYLSGAPATGLALYYKDVAGTYTAPALAAANSAAASPPVTPAGYTALTTTPATYQAGATTSANATRAGDIIQVALGVADSTVFTGGGNSNTALPNILFSYDES
jgi:hypothetical protein